MIGFAPTINPGRHRRQKARVQYHLTKGRQERQQKAAADQRNEDFHRHHYAERVRLIRQIKAVLGFPLLQYEDYEYISNYRFSKTVSHDKVQVAMRYFDPAITAENFDKLMVTLDQFYMIESWVNKRHTMVECFEFKGPWHNRQIKHSDVFPDFNDPYWFDPKQVNMTHENWREWKIRPIKELLEEAIKTVEEVNRDYFNVWQSDQIYPTDKNTSTGDGLKDPDVVWNGMSSEHFTPRKRLWPRIIAALTNRKP